MEKWDWVAANGQKTIWLAQPNERSHLAGEKSCWSRSSSSTNKDTKDTDTNTQLEVLEFMFSRVIMPLHYGSVGCSARLNDLQITSMDGPEA